MAGALQGIKVIDLTRVLAGPYCSMILGDLGADVIKVESPLHRDETRGWGPPYTSGESAYYLCANRNKRAMTLNLRSQQGREIFKKLVRQSDVVIENFKYGTMRKWGLGYDTLESWNPQIILASITGFGQHGPYRDRPGYDYIIQAMGGLMSITGTPEQPMKVGVAIADILTGLYTAIGILAALQERNFSGKGQQVDLSLFDAQVSALINVAGNYLVSGKIPERMGNQHPNIVPYQVFETADGNMVVAVGNDQQFARFTRVIGLPQLSEDERFQTNSARVQNRRELIPLISRQMLHKTADEWASLLHDAGIPNGPINDMKSLFEDPQVQARDMLVEMAHPTAELVRLVGSPIKLSRSPVEMKRHPPLYGEHTENILDELGFTREEIRHFRANQDI